MAIDRQEAREYLKNFDFRRLFLDQLGWDKHSGTLQKVIDGQNYRFTGVSEKRGVVVLVCDVIPEYGIRLKLDKAVAKDHFEHLIVFTDKARGRQIWQWMRRESGKPSAVRAYVYHVGQTGELLLQKLEHLVVALDEEETTGLADVLSGMRAGFDVEKVTEKFYEQFKAEHERFMKFVDGIPDKEMESWYVSVMINRLMFLYFIQAKGFLNGDLDYLQNKLKESRDRKKDAYYKEFLAPLFFEGFARKKDERTASTNKLLGNIPYLNGGLFQRHQIEELHGKKIHIPDKAFEALFSFFKEYNWHLDERENRNDKEIDPDVLGYIFEKYINQKQMGAYYSKEDITGYISRNTIIPFLLDSARRDCAVAFDNTGGVWRLLRDDPDRYIYEPVRHGVSLPLSKEIAAGLTEVKKRVHWNKSAPSEYALPTETWREVIERRDHYQEVRHGLARGEVLAVNDLIALNLDVRQFIQDVIQYCEGPELLRALYKSISKVSVLDPTCGSGAFLFAALNILKPLYEACLQRMQMFVDELEANPAHHPKKFEDFRQILEESRQHPNQDYFILKQIIVSNLYGVDIMEEAIEICKLRLFLKLVAQVESQDQIEPLPDIDFNIQAGNTLVGYTQYATVERALGSKFDFENAIDRIEDKARTLDAALELFRRQQTHLHGTVTTADKMGLQSKFRELEEELNDVLGSEYGVKKSDMKAWKNSHKPLHWFSDFHRIMHSGGFDVIIGNPPYVETNKITEYSLGAYRTRDAGNIYAPCVERFSELLREDGRLGVIVPLSGFSTERMAPYQELVRSRFPRVFISFYSGDAHPSVMFNGVKYRLCIILGGNDVAGRAGVYTSAYRRWYATERETLFPTLVFSRCVGESGYLRFAKTGSTLANAVLSKMVKKTPPLASLFRRSGSVHINYHRSPVFWIRSMDFEPYFHSATRSRSLDHLRDLYFDNRSLSRAIGAVINSTCFYFWFCVQGNCRNIAGPDLEGFPLGTLSEEAVHDLERVFTTLIADLRKHSKRRVYNYETSGRVEYDEFYPAKSKATIDQIDQILARHYGFNDRELDFIINYDIKYRLGADDHED